MSVPGQSLASQKSPSAKSCFITRLLSSQCVYPHCALQKAPSAKRCIKTLSCCQLRGRGTRVRKHRAPKGALRLRPHIEPEPVHVRVRKHRAPKGALRLIDGHFFEVHWFACQKAPSAKRCIKTFKTLCPK